MRRPALAFAALCAVGACAHPPMHPPPAPPSPACNAEAAAFAIGRTLDAALQEEVRQRAGAQRLRVVRPGQRVTMDFDEARLTVDLDAQGRVAGLRCG